MEVSRQHAVYWKSKWRGVCQRVLLIVGIIAVGLFVAGPQMGSIDENDDGIPDIAVVVSSPRCADFSRFTLMSQQAPAATKSSIHALIEFSTQESELPRFESTNAAVYSPSVTVLRC